MHKKICIVTGGRCDYGLLFWLMKEIKADPEFQLQIIATGMHLSPEFGLTYKKIVEDGFAIDEKVEILLSSDTSVGITKSLGLGVIGFADAYARLQPDLVVILGDRFEALAATQAAFLAKIPIAHLHGGELTLGAYDDGIRHSITKMSHLHFVAHEQYRQRVIQLGEQPDRVYTVGPMALDPIKSLTLLEKDALAQQLKVKFNTYNFAVTFHPETLGDFLATDQLQIFLEAISSLQDAFFIFTKSNADTEGLSVNRMIDEFCAKNSHRAKSFSSLGQRNYFSLLAQVDAVLGNSSSGIIEAPYFKVPTINIGDRQKGRVRFASVIDCPCERQAILQAINQALLPGFKQEIKEMVLPGDDKPVAKEIVKIIKKMDLAQLVKKSFYELTMG